MADHITPEQRHANMAAIHSKNTKPEMVVRRYLWGQGFRYRLNHPRLPGKPDIVMRKYRTCIFVNGCFWHGHGVTGPLYAHSECCKIPKTHTDFWIKKIQRNQNRDREVQQKLAFMGWHSITIWECQLKPGRRQQTLESLAYTLNSIFLNDHSTHRYAVPEEEPMQVAEEMSGYDTDKPHSE